MRKILHKTQNSDLNGVNYYSTLACLTKWKRSICISDFMQTTFFYLERFQKNLADNLCSSIMNGNIYYMKTMSIQAFSVKVDSPEIWHSMEVSTICFIFAHTAFFLGVVEVLLSDLNLDYSYDIDRLSEQLSSRGFLGLIAAVVWYLNSSIVTLYVIFILFHVFHVSKVTNSHKYSVLIVEVSTHTPCKQLTINMAFFTRVHSCWLPFFQSFLVNII